MFRVTHGYDNDAQAREDRARATFEAAIDQIRAERDEAAEYFAARGPWLDPYEGCAVQAKRDAFQVALDILEVAARG